MSAVYQFCIAASEEAEEWFSAEELGITVTVRNRVHAGVDSVTVAFCGQTILTDEAIWSFGTAVRMRLWDGGNGTYLFLGRVQPFSRTATGVEQGTSVEIRGIWDWFENITFRQQFHEDDEETWVTSPRVVLFGSRTTGAQIRQAVECAIESDCPVAVGSIANGYTPPRDEQMNVTVADVIIKALANHPHACLWIDYSTRTPTLNVATRQSLPSFSVALADLQGESLSIKSREDLQKTAVAIDYVRTNTDGERTWISNTIDKAPSGATDAQLYSVNGLWGVFELQGMNAQYIEQQIEVEAIDWENNKSLASWWQERVPSIADATVVSIDNPSGQYSWPNFLISGSIADWMNEDYDEETFTADATLEFSNSEGVSEKKVQKISFTATTTTASSKTYRKQTSFDSGDIPPGGLAAQLLAEWQQLHYDGEIVLAAQDAPLGAGPGMTLNITGGRAAWASMAAMIISVSENLGNGRVAIRFGVPQWIDLDSRMAWVRNCRLRRFGWAVENQTGGVDASASGGQAFPTVKPGAQPTVWLRQRFIDPSADVKHEVDINLADIASETKQTLKLREVLIPYDDSGTVKAKLAQALCSESYGDPLTIGGGRPATPSNVVTRGASTETDLSSSAAYDPATPDSGKDGVTVYVSLGGYYDHSSGTPVLKEFRVALTWPNAIAPKISAASTVDIDTPES